MTKKNDVKPALTPTTSEVLERYKLETPEDKFNAIRKMVQLEGNAELDYDFSKERGQIFLAVMMGEWEVDSGRFAVQVSELLGLEGKKFLRLEGTNHSFVETEEATLFDEETIQGANFIYRNPNFYVKEYELLQNAGGDKQPGVQSTPGWLVSTEDVDSSQVTSERSSISALASELPGKMDQPSTTESSSNKAVNQGSNPVTPGEQQALKIIKQAQIQFREQDKERGLSRPKIIGRQKRG